MEHVSDESILNSGICVVKFWATWCGPCKKMEPTIFTLESEFGASSKFLAVDVDDVPSIAKKFQIKSLPTILILKDGQEINRIVGLSLIEPIRSILREICNSSEVNAA